MPTKEETLSVLIDPKSVEAMQAGDADGVPQIKVFLKSGNHIALHFPTMRVRDQALVSFSNMFIGHIAL